MKLDKIQIQDIIKRAVKEDVWTGDITTDNLISDTDCSTGVFIAKEEGIVAGLFIAEEVFSFFNKEIKFEILIEEGSHVEKGTELARVSGHTRSILKGERLALNFLQRISGIASRTYNLVERVNNYSAKIVDTRKTTPTLRLLEKYAVRAGGGYNHRMGLYDAVMIKDNHIKAAGGIMNAVEKIRTRLGHTIKIEVEVETKEETKEALQVEADIIMLDNMSIEEMKEAVEMIDKRAVVEASGGITSETVEKVASTGVDVISVGALTHHIKALDISLNLKGDGSSGA